MKKIRPWTLLLVMALAAFSLVIVARAHNHADPPSPDEDEENEAATQAPPPVSIVNGETVVKLARAAQTRLGIRVEALESTSLKQEATAPALVLATQDLVTSRQNYLIGETALRKAEIAAAAARKEYERLKILYQDNRNASQRAVDAAQAVLESSQADAQAARQQLAMATDAVRQSWGSAVAGWVGASSSELQQVLDGRELLVEVTFPGRVAAAPRVISLDLSGARLGSAALVSSFPRVDSRVQGLSFLYRTTARSGLAPGATLEARFAAGREMRGVVVPSAAIVWRNGTAWAYVRTAPDGFTRRAVPVAISVPGGFFVTTGFAAGDRVVTTGAESLLSAESGAGFEPED